MQKAAEQKAGKNIQALVLAAGCSKRMAGKNKLLATMNGTPLIKLVVQAALASRVDSVTVVTGFEAQKIKEALQGNKVRFVHNHDYASGMASSLRTGLRSLATNSDGALIMLADMPFVGSEQIDLLIEEFVRSADNAIVVPVFNNQLGNPRLWAHKYFEAMCGCDGDVGARHLIEKFSTMVKKVEMNDAKVLTDIDTPAELALLTENLTKADSI